MDFQQISLTGLQTLAKDIASILISGPVFNQYALHSDPSINQANAHRICNLLRYWQLMATRRPSVLLVGEAPGYRGCRLTGVPFTSPAIISQSIHGLPFFGEGNGFRQPHDCSNIQRESSATIVWQSIRNLKPLPLLWNAFPFHPFRPGTLQSNRRPSTDELRIGLSFTVQIVELFNIQTVVAVGNVASDALAQAGIPAHKVRHPSHGGKVAFISGLHALYRTSDIYD